MRYLYLLYPILLFCSGLHAQHCLFFPFGISQTDVIDSLAAYSYVKWDQRSDNLIWAEWDQRWMEYEFSENKLYLIRSGKYLGEKKEAKALIQGVVSYLGQSSLWVTPKRISHGHREWMGYRFDRWQQFSCQKHKGYYALEISSYSLAFTPEVIRSDWVARNSPAFDPGDLMQLRQVAEKFLTVIVP